MYLDMTIIQFERRDHFRVPFIQYISEIQSQILISILPAAPCVHMYERMMHRKTRQNSIQLTDKNRI